MVVPKEIRKCVAFLGCKSTSAFRLVGTAFFVSRQVPGTDDLMEGYAVTAKHVIDQTYKYSMDEKFTSESTRAEAH